MVRLSKLGVGLQDKDKNGYVDVDELTNLHSTTKERLTMLEAKKILEVGMCWTLAHSDSFLSVGARAKA